METINFDEFKKVELKIVKIIEAKRVEESNLKAWNIRKKIVFHDYTFCVDKVYFFEYI